jgi:hypothetical protein
MSQDIGMAGLASDAVVGHDANFNDLNNASYTMRYHVPV